MPATTSGKKSKVPQDHKKKPNGFGKKQTFTVTVPSGNQVELKRPGLQGLIKAGILESFDQLTAIVQGEVIPKAEGKPVVNSDMVKEIARDPQKLRDVTDMMDRVVKYVVSDPKLYDPIKLDDDLKPILDDDGKTIPVIDDEDRRDDVAYIDWVSDEDKGFIMNFAMGGSEDLNRFREESEAALANVPDGESAADPS